MLLELKAVSKAFGEEGELSRQQVLRDLNLTLKEGESTAILGPSGSGKTTLLNLIGGLDSPDQGSLLFKGQDLGQLDERGLDHFRNREIGFVFQFHHLLPQCTLLENVLIPTLLQREREEKTKVRDRAEALLKRVGIWEHRHKLPGKLSGGECQRTAVVRAMINGPSLLLADEPTGALDQGNVEGLSELLLDLKREEGMALLVVTHSAELARGMGRSLRLEQGKLVEA